VAAVSTAQRVAVELGTDILDTKNKSSRKMDKDSGVVGYQIRFDSSTVRENTKIKFMTDGILLREVSRWQRLIGPCRLKIPVCFQRLKSFVCICQAYVDS